MSKTQKSVTPETYSESLERRLPPTGDQQYDEIVDRIYALSEGVWLSPEQKEAAVKIGAIAFRSHGSEKPRRPNRWE